METPNAITIVENELCRYRYLMTAFRHQPARYRAFDIATSLMLISYDSLQRQWTCI